MLPASYQPLAGVILIAGGLISCFAGYRFFRVVLGIYGFIVGAVIATTISGGDDSTRMLLAAGLGGLIGAIILVLAYFVGVALVGAGLGALSANLIWAQLGSEPNPLVIVLFSVVGALIALALQRYVIIVATAFGGSWVTILGVLAALGRAGSLAAATRANVWLAYPTNPLPGQQRNLFFGWIALGVIGMIVQLGFTARGRK
jgi:hypothetical protein